MSTVESATSITGLSQASAGASNTTGSTTTGLSDYDDFLSLLTTQLKNQDPLNPQDSTEFVEQIATFTGVEQQLNTNAKLDELIAVQTSSALSDLAQWVGRAVSAEGMQIDYNGGDVTLTAPNSGGASEAAVVIKDQNGSEIARLPVDPKGGEVVWDGAKTEGGVALAGLYQVEYAFTTNTPTGPEVRIEKGTSTGVVAEARINDAGRTELVLQGGLIVVDPGAVTSVLDASQLAGDTGGQSVIDDVEDVAETVEDAAETVSEAVS